MFFTGTLRWKRFFDQVGKYQASLLCRNSIHWIENSSLIIGQEFESLSENGKTQGRKHYVLLQHEALENSAEKNLLLFFLSVFVPK